MNQNPISKSNGHGQSVWLDFLRRNPLEAGDLQRLIEQGGFGGPTSDPSIFEKAIPRKPYTFGNLKNAQALRDLQALWDHGRRARCVQPEPDVHKGLFALSRALASALKEIRLKP